METVLTLNMETVLTLNMEAVLGDTYTLTLKMETVLCDTTLTLNIDTETVAIIYRTGSPQGFTEKLCSVTLYADTKHGNRAR